MAHIVIVGSGFVGQATGKTLVTQGNIVTFTDIDEQKLLELERQGYRTSRSESLREERMDIIFFAVPTPTVPGKGVDLSFLEKAAAAFGKTHLRRLNNYPVIVIKSTVPPGTTRSFVTPLLEHTSRKKAGKDFGVVMEPEFLREKTSLKDAQNPRLIILGTADRKAAAIMEKLRSAFGRKVHILQPEEAELEKYVHNLWNATKISFFNEMRFVCDELDIHDRGEKIFELAMESAEASWNARYGTRDFGPFGGSCLPKDTSGFLLWSSKNLGTDLPVLEGVIETNKIVERHERQAANPFLIPSSLGLKARHRNRGMKRGNGRKTVE